MQPRSSSCPMFARIATALVVLAGIVFGGCSDDEATFCGTVQEYNEAALSEGAVINIDSSQSEAEVAAQVDSFEALLEQQFAEQRRLLDDLHTTAPAAVREDVGLLVGQALASGVALRAADFDVIGYAEQHQPSAAEAAERAAASRRVAQFTEDECGEPLVIAEVAGVPDQTLAEIRELLPAVPPPPAPPDPPAPPEPPSAPDPASPEPTEAPEVEPVEPGY